MRNRVLCPAFCVVDGVLVWRRAFGRPRNVVVLPEGWMLTANAVPASVDNDARGRLRLTYVNPRNDEIDVLIRAERLAASREGRPYHRHDPHPA